MKQNLFILLASLTFAVSCENKKAVSPATASATVPATSDSNLVQFTSVQLGNSGIQTAAVETRQMHTALTVNGVMDVSPNNIVSISIPLGGYIKQMGLIEGAKIRKGAVLAMAEDQQYIQLQQDYLTAKVRLEFLDADFKRQRDLNETKATSDKVFQQTKSDYESQRILLRSLAEKLRLIGINPGTLSEDNISRTIRVLSPINGYVTKVNVNNGKYVSPSDVLFELMDPNDLHLSLTVFENDAASLKVGQKITCFTNNKPEVKYTATIHLITPNIGEDRATEVHCHFDNENKGLLPGTFMNAVIELNNKTVVAVPEEAVVKWENKNYLFTKETATSFRFVPVETGVSEGGYTEIRSPLPGKDIVTKNAYTILMKMKNNIEEG